MWSIRSGSGDVEKRQQKDGTKHYYSEVTANYVGTVPKAAKAAAPGQSFDDMGNAAEDEEIPF